jgi:hypothetical protein
MGGSLICHGCWPSFATLHCDVQFDWYSDWDFHANALTCGRADVLAAFAPRAPSNLFVIRPNQ